MENEASEWLEFAENDYGVAKHLYETYYPKPIEIICFHCQQCAEKAVKSVIVHLGSPGGMPKLHDISFLLNQIKNNITIDEKYYDYGDVLTPYGIAPRYPQELFLEEHHAVKAIEYAGEFLSWAKTNLQ